ncbi:MAG: GntR family transcriptional regulator [Chloroflexi bacterium]|nr:MAG: GntR family transcriptional regulator [Chloroflexota bacterium]TME58651.1 MAG: GntR family transcriptional regulator [Chloroflexota bacterium]
MARTKVAQERGEPRPGRKGASELGFDAYRRLREAIIAGRFVPNERLVEANLSKAFGAGRTAVRAALVRLDQEGLVTREHNRGARVRLVSDDEALQIEEVRAALERLLARQAAAKATASDIRELRHVLVDMRKCFAKGDAIGYSELNPRFHQLIWMAARNPTAGRLVGTLKSQSLRFQYQTMLRPGRTERSLREHELIFSAIVAHDPESADAAMRDHLEEVLETLRWAIGHKSRPPQWLPD